MKKPLLFLAIFFGLAAAGGAIAFRSFPEIAPWHSAAHNPKNKRQPYYTTATITITPPSGTVVHPGQEVEVVFDVQGGNASDRATFSVIPGYLPLGSTVEGDGPYAYRFTVPDMLGELTVLPQTWGDGPESYVAKTVLRVEPAAELVSLRPGDEKEYLRGEGAGSQIELYGRYADGKELEIPQERVAFRLLPGGEAFVSLSPEGEVTARETGQATVIAEYGGMSVPVLVKSQVSNHIPRIAQVEPVTLKTGEALDIPLSATDADGHRIAFTLLDPPGAPLPGFARITDHGDGTATLALTPGTEDAGQYQLIVDATDNYRLPTTGRMWMEVRVE